MPRSERLLAARGVEFLTGTCPFLDSVPGRRDPLPRIYVPFRPHGSNLRSLALLDTGGHFCILSPELAELLGEELSGSHEVTTLLTAAGRLSGRLYRHNVELLAEEGEDLELEATVFVSSAWRGPSVLGYTGVLDRVRFAVDPRESQLYFGSLDT